MVVEFVKVLSLVLVVGVTISWKRSLLVVGAALLTLAVLVAIFGSTLVLVLPTEVLRLIIGLILLIVFFATEKLKRNNNKTTSNSSGSKLLKQVTSNFLLMRIKEKVVEGDG